MSTSPHRLITGVIAILLAASWLASGSPWATQVVAGPDILLHCPELVGAQTARSLLADRQRALAFAEEALGGELFRRLIITIEPTLLSSWGTSEPTDGGAAITLGIPVSALERFETAGISPFDFVGCHEEVHAVANHLWLGDSVGVPMLLSEGIAVYVEELRRQSELHLSIAGALRAAGLLHDLDVLLGSALWDELARVAELNVYYGGGAFAQFLLEREGMATFARLYGTDWFRWEIQGTVPHVVETDPIEAIYRVYGTGLCEMNREWQTWVADRAPCSREDAELFLRAYTEDIAILDEPTLGLEEYWVSAPYRLVGPSATAAGLVEEAREALFVLAGLRGVPLRSAYAQFVERVDGLQELLAGWLDAIRAYEEALQLESEGATVDEIAGRLEAAKTGYRTAGDDIMAHEVAEWLTRLATGSAE